MSKLTLYLSQHACSMAPHIALTEAGARFDTVHVALSRGEQHLPAYLEINPHAKVPALAIDDTVLTENVAIASWIDQAFPDAGVLPGRTPFDKAQTLSRLAWLNSEVHTAFGPLIHPEQSVAGREAQAELKQNARTRILGQFAELDGLLAERDWLVGDFSYLDGYLFAITTWAENMLRLDVAGNAPHVFAHFQRMQSRDSVKHVLAEEAELAAAA